MNIGTLSFLAFISCMGQASFAQKKAPATLISDTIPFELTEHNNISIQAVLNGVDTVQLMFHTAANDVTVITEAIAKVPSISWDQDSKVQSWGGESDARFSTHNSLQIGKARWDSLAVWETKNSGPSTDGKFGPNLFEGKVIEIDFDMGYLIIHATLPEKVSAFEKLALQYEDGFMFIEGISRIGEQDYPRRFLLHSGYGGSILYDDAFAEESKIGAQIEITSEQELKDSYGNVIKTKKGTLPLLTIGTTSFTDVPVGFFEGSIGRQKMSVMGGEILKRFHWVIGASREYVYLKAG